MNSKSRTENRPRLSDTRQDHFHGLLLVDKPRGLTSHDVVGKIRWRFNFKKVGHGGTLDPMATGLLVLLMGKKATRISQEVMGGDKTYEGTMRLGTSTNTQDAEGKVLEERDFSGVDADMVETEMAKWRGDIRQVPPMVSAIKRDGVPLYKLARRDQDVEREARIRHIYSFKMLAFEPPDVDFRVKCTKGTYVRTLCDDIGKGLGCGAHLSQLRRTASGKLSIDHALELNDILKMDLEEISNHTIPITTTF